MAAILIFGFGSLISRDSLLHTAPDAFDIAPAFIKGFRRSFSAWDDVGWTETNLDLAGQAMCALDVVPVSDTAAKVNGVVFKVGEPGYQRLLQREVGYQLMKTRAYSYADNLEIGECLVFSANKQDGEYDFNSAAQKRYLDICLASARLYGGGYYQEFLKTTFIDDRALTTFPDLLEG